MLFRSHSRSREISPIRDINKGETPRTNHAPGGKAPSGEVGLGSLPAGGQGETMPSTGPGGPTNQQKSPNHDLGAKPKSKKRKGQKTGLTPEEKRPNWKDFLKEDKAVHFPPLATPSDPKWAYRNQRRSCSDSDPESEPENTSKAKKGLREAFEEPVKGMLNGQKKLRRLLDQLHSP